MSAPGESDPLHNGPYGFAARLAMAMLMVCFLLFFAACGTVEYTHDTAPRMVIVSDGTPFYLHGPAQGNGEDRKLSEGDEVLVLRKEFGYSFVELGDGKLGYVANESLVTAPPEPSPTPESRPLTHETPPPESPHPEEETNAPGTNLPVDPPGFRY